MVDPEANRSFIKIHNNAYLFISGLFVDKYYFPGGFISNYQ